MPVKLEPSKLPPDRFELLKLDPEKLASLSFTPFIRLFDRSHWEQDPDEEWIRASTRICASAETVSIIAAKNAADSFMANPDFISLL